MRVRHAAARFCSLLDSGALKKFKAAAPQQATRHPFPGGSHI